MALEQRTRGSSGRSQLDLLKKWLLFPIQRYRSLHRYGKLFAIFLLCFYIAIGAAVIIITPERIAQFLYDKAQELSAQPLGWLILSTAIVVVSFPPLIGHTTLVTLCGFAYGMKGFAIASTASLLGSAFAFIVLRLLFRQRLRVWSRSNEKWQALEAVVRAKGLPLIILIRISPFPPWVYSQTLFASIESASFWQFCFATLFVFPKLLLHVFIGTRISALSDGEQRKHMDAHTKAINGALVGGSIVFAITISWLVYTMIQKHIRHLEGVPPQVDELAAEYIEDYGEEAPLLTELSPRNSTDH